MLSVKGLTFGYRKHQQQIVDLSLELASGEVLGLLGPNGAGKTTLVSLLIGQQRPRAGQILLDGEPVTLGHPDIALVPQEYAFYPRLSVAENLAYFAGVQGLTGARRRERLEAAIAAGDLGSVTAKRAGALSGGFKRRLNLAIALLQQPRLMILDEPTANVDPHSRAFLLESLKRVNRAGTSIIYTSHLLGEVESIAHRVAVMAGGQIRLSGSLDDLLSEQREWLYVRLDAAPPEPLAATIAARPGEDGWWQCQLSASGLSAAQTLSELERAERPPRQIRYGQRQLEQVYLDCLADSEETE